MDERQQERSPLSADKGGKIVFRTTKEQTIGGKEINSGCVLNAALVLVSFNAVQLLLRQKSHVATLQQLDASIVWAKLQSPSVDSSRFKPGRRFTVGSERAAASGDGADTLRKKRLLRKPATRAAASAGSSAGCQTVNSVCQADGERDDDGDGERAPRS